MVELQPASDPEIEQGQASSIDLGPVPPDRGEPEHCPFCGFCEADPEVRWC